MARRIEKKYQVIPGPHGTRQVIQTGRCDGSSQTIQELTGDVSDGVLVKLPNASGVVWKYFDGRRPNIYNVSPPTMAITVRCVKVEADMRPLAPLQDGGAFDGSTVCQYRIVYQEVPA